MKKIITLAIFATILSCKKDNNLENSSSLSNEITEKIFLEKENWKNELVINGDIGPPCTDDYNKWAEDNPNGYYGLPKEINHKVSDFNNDGKEDILLYFPAGSPCNGGNSASSDFSELVYSKGDKYLYNKNLTSKIESLIKEEFNIKTKSYGNNSVLFFIKDFNKQITGNYILWTEDDAHCCPSFSGNYRYDLLTRTITIDISKSIEQ